jgi:hypothetical protein
VQEEDGYFFIDRDHYKFKVEFTQHEGLALHLAARLLTTNTDKHNPHAASALCKLGEATQGFAPLFNEHLQRSADVMDDDVDRHAAQQLIARVTFDGPAQQDHHFECCAIARGLVPAHRIVDLIRCFIELVLVRLCRILCSVLRCIV